MAQPPLLLIHFNIKKIAMRINEGLLLLNSVFSFPMIRFVSINYRQMKFRIKSINNKLIQKILVNLKNNKLTYCRNRVMKILTILTNKS